jgi:hypothetical protein
MSIADAIDKNYARLERQLLQVGEGMTAEGFSFRPTPEVRSFGLSALGCSMKIHPWMWATATVVHSP